MQQIKLDEKFLSLVLTGKKRTTVRSGTSVYNIGPAEILVAHSINPISINITDVRYTVFEKLTEKDAISDGFDALESLQEALHDFYPSLNGKDPVTIVTFNLLTF